ncbi:DUF4864 domain-containing protein [Planktotalea sp.]|uniref:DUF4864 domain-containing protein n=1 Tax=Planktotalea sp. TaxID=2029877 RepID=UPI0032990E19
MLKRFLAVLSVLSALVVGGTLHADDAAKPAITNTIQSQLDALILDDFDQAFTYASPMIQGMFGTPQNFGTMVSRGYPMVHRPADVSFLDLRSIGGRLYQKVQISDVEGRIHHLDYEMIQSPNGWKINGVQLLKTPQVSV